MLVFLALAIPLALVALAAAPWGPGTHIQLTLELLHRFERKRQRRPEQELVLRHPGAFLYGNIAADIINFKAYGGVKNHCHNWSIHERLEALARDEGSRAFILGYLCHLAADVVAHNHLVPYHLVYGFPPRVLAHAYWEAMADVHVSDREWHELDALKRSRAIHAFDRMVHDAVRRKALGLRSNKWIFNNILLLSCRRRWRTLVRSVQNGARTYPLDAGFHGLCRRRSLYQMLAVFHERRLALLKARDPTGRAALLGAGRMRRELKREFGHRARAREIAREMARAAFGRLE
jgi:hypothetical protein